MIQSRQRSQDMEFYGGLYNGDHNGILCYFMVISRDSMGFYGALVGFHGDLDGWECAMVKLDGFFFISFGVMYPMGILKQWVYESLFSWGRRGG